VYFLQDLPPDPENGDVVVPNIQPPGDNQAVGLVTRAVVCDGKTIKHRVRCLANTYILEFVLSNGLDMPV
jgi:hypothetical protein